MPESVLCRRIRTFFTDYALDSGKPIVVGLSGGADSTALTLALRDLGFSLTAVHVCHHLRGETAQRDALFCEALCRRCAIPFIRKDVYVREHLDGRSIEEAARDLRYAALLEVCPENSLLAIAHNANDAVETALFNLARGTGAAGLGIVPVRPLTPAVSLIRPILRCTREDILRELEDRGQDFVEDETNGEEEAARNILRHACIPAMRRVNAKAVENAAAALEHLRMDYETLNEEAHRLATVPASAKALREAPKSLAAKAFLLLYHHKDLTRRHIEALHTLCATSEGSGRVSLPGRITAVREYDALRFVPSEPPSDTAFFEKKLKIGETTGLPEIGLQITVKKTKTVPENSDSFYNIHVDSGAIHGILSVRPRQAQDSFRMARGGCHKTVKKAMIDAHIPRSLREVCPVILCGDAIVAVRGLGAAAEFAGKAGDDGLLICFEPLSPT